MHNTLANLPLDSDWHTKDTIQTTWYDTSLDYSSLFCDCERLWVIEFQTNDVLIMRFWKGLNECVISEQLWNHPPIKDHQPSNVIPANYTIALKVWHFLFF